MNQLTNSRQGSSFLPGLLLGGLVGLTLTTVLVSIIGFVWVQKKARDVRRGWNLTPVVIATDDIHGGTVVTFDMISQRQIPEQFVTASVVNPNGANAIVGQRLAVDVRAGDPLLWSQFQTQKLTPGLIAARDIPVGATLSAKDMEPRGLAPDIVTPSYVKEAERPQVVGRPVIAAFRKGDPILWTHVQSEPPPMNTVKVP